MRVALLSLSSKKKINKFWTNKNHIWIKNNIYPWTKEKKFSIHDYRNK